MKLPANYETMHWTERKAVREEYVRRQDGKCQHCGESLAGEPSSKVRGKSIRKSLFPKSFFNYPVHLHHCHKTGMTIGAVHNRCNAVLWQYHGE